MNKRQEKCYKWILNHPGYLKKGPGSIPYTSGNISIKDVEIALKEARKSFNERPKKKLDNYLLDVFNKGKFKLDNVNSKFKKTYHKVYNPYKYDVNNVLAVADMHEPFCKEGYLEHCIEIRDKYKCGTIVLIGDEVDLCGIGQWEKDPDGFSPGTEASKAQAKMQLWYNEFPEAFVCIGNHTARPFRMARANGIPKKFIKTYEEAWNAPIGWKWADSWDINNVHYTHGTGHSGAGAAIKIATRHRQNTVIGHIHSEAGIQYSASKIDLVWGMQLGGALDDSSYAAYYAKDQIKKSIIGCGVVINGTLPIYEPMKL